MAFINLDLKTAEAQLFELRARLRAAPREDRRLVDALRSAVALKAERVERLRAASSVRPAA